MKTKLVFALLLLGLAARAATVEVDFNTNDFSYATGTLRPINSEKTFAVTGDQTLVATNSNQLLIWNSATNCTVTWPSAHANGWNITLKNLGAGALVYAGAGGETWDGLSAVTQTTGVILHWTDDGTHFRSGRSSPSTFVYGNKFYASPADGSTNLMTARRIAQADVTATATPALGSGSTNIVVDFQYTDLYLEAGVNMSIASFANQGSTNNPVGTILTVRNTTAPTVLTFGNLAGTYNGSAAFNVTITNMAVFSFRSYGTATNLNGVVIAQF